MGARFLMVSIRIIRASAIIALILLLLATISLILYHIVMVCRACRRALSTNIDRRDECFKAGNGLSLEDLQKLPCFEFSAPDDEDDERVSAMNCVVCLESFEAGDLCRILPVCRHSFHAYCVDCWLARNPVCPICRSSAAHRRGGDEL